MEVVSLLRILRPRVRSREGPDVGVICSKGDPSVGKGVLVRIGGGVCG